MARKSPRLVSWAYLERVPPSMHGAWPADSARVDVKRAHFLEHIPSRPGWILVEYISGEREEWPLAECRRLGV